MKSKNKRPGDRRAAALGAAIAVLTGLFFLMTPLGDGFRLRSYDLLFLVRPPTAPAALQNVVILSMDEESSRALSQDPDRPWDRAVHTRLLKELTTRGAGLVVFDALWNEPSANPLIDEQLTAAIREHGRVVLAAHWRGSRGDRELAHVEVLLRPTNPIGTNAPWGLVEWPINPGSSRIIRRQFYHPTYPTMPWQAAAVLQQAPLNRAMTYWINYYGLPGTIPTVSYHRALTANSLPPDFFAGKAIFVGKAPIITAKGQVLDSFPTPYTLSSGKWTPGVEIEATAFLNLVRHEWLEELPPVPSLLLVLVLGLVLGAGLCLIRPWPASVVAAASLLLIVTASAWLTWRFHFWYPWLVVCAVQIPVALAWSALAHTRRVDREKESLQRDVALAESVAGLPELLSPPDHSPLSLPMNPDPDTPSPLPSPPLRAGERVPEGRERGDESTPPPIPNHHLLRCIGRGAYGEVWLARDDIGTYHAVKVVHRRRFGSADPFEREFRGIQKFTPISRSHPGFVHILHVGRNEADGYFFYIMELGDDQHAGPSIDPSSYSPNTLAGQLEMRKRFPLSECVQLGLDLAAALDHLHQHQLVHRDIKPSNILFVNHAPKFADAGLVTNLAVQGVDTTYLGTEGYIAPEGPGTASADVYGLGKVLYECATGLDRRQFPALPSVLIEEAPSDLPQWNEIILKACQAEASQRYQSAAELRADLLRLSQRLDARARV